MAFFIMSFWIWQKMKTMMQWLAGKLDFLAVFDIKWGNLNGDYVQ